MAREVNPNREKAKQIYIEHAGNITNRKIAEALGEDEKKIAVWKQRDNWTNTTVTPANVVQQKKANKKNVVQQRKKSTSKEIKKSTEEVKNNLTVKQEKFVQGLFSGLSQREAYKQAYNCENWTDNAIDVEASVLANSPKISLRIRELTDELKERNMVTVEKVLAELAKIGFADIKDFLEFRTEKTVAGRNDDGTPIFEYQNIVEAKPSDLVDGTLISEVSIGKDGTFKFKLHSKDTALDKMGKYLKMFTDKKEISGPNGGPIEAKTTHDLSKLSDEELNLLERIIEKSAE